MSDATTRRSAPRRGIWARRILLLLITGGIVGAGGWYALTYTFAADTDETLTWTAQKTNMRISVTERGTLQSQKTVNGICELEGYDNKIIFIVEEGATVQKDQVVVRLDSSAIDQRIAERNLEVTQAQGVVDTKAQELEVQKNTNESDIATAELELTLADLDLEKYENGDYEVELSDLRGKIALASVELEKAEESLQNTKELVRKGFREPEQVRTAEQSLESAKFNLERDERQLSVLVKYDHKRKLTEFKAKADEAKRKLARAKSNAEANLKKATSEHEAAIAELDIQKQNLAEAKLQKERCEIKAGQTGVVAYANEEWWSESRRIREGGTVYERQVVFFIPDMSLMQVEAKVHESEVKRITAGQRALIRVDAFANQSFTGTVKSVAQLSESDRFFGSGVKEYTTIITFDEKASVALRPGMTAEVEILVDNLTDVLAVPVQAIAEHRHKHFVYVQNASDEFQRGEVEIGQTNNRLIVITSGLDAGAVVALDARSRAATEFADDDGSHDSDELTGLKRAEVLTTPDDAATDPDAPARDDSDDAATNAAESVTPEAVPDPAAPNSNQPSVPDEVDVPETTAPANGTSGPADTQSNQAAPAGEALSHDDASTNGASHDGASTEPVE